LKNFLYNDQIKYKKLGFIGTFHSLCAKILEIDAEQYIGIARDYLIYDEGDQIKIIKDIFKRKEELKLLNLIML